MPKEETSWGKEAVWYDSHLQGGDTYHEQVILPNLLRLLGPLSGKKVIELGCGQGFFSLSMAKGGAAVTATDISKELIEIARNRDKASSNPRYEVRSAHQLFDIQSGSYDIAVIVLALQNIKELEETLKECKRVLNQTGRLLVVLNHPCFRIPQASSWGFDEEKNVQYRRVDSYLSESNSQIDMHPGESNKSFTISFHRPLQVYMKMLSKSGFALTKIEEWISHRKSQKGPRAKAEDISRKEIPLFMYLEATSSHHV
jgi:ubiquinone/menaquinone biosynthesis C-methylase UbiE